MVSSRVLMRASTNKLLPSCRNQVLCCVVDHRTRALAWWAEFWPGVSLPLNLFPVSLLLGGHYYRFHKQGPNKTLCLNAYGKRLISIPKGALSKMDCVLVLLL